MKNKEIEEILNELKQHLEYQKEVSDIDSNVAYLRLTIKKYRLLLSYIEQLEKRNKELYEGFMATQEELTDYATKNELQKERIAYLERSNNRREDTIISLRDELNDSEDCREKAIEQCNDWIKIYKKLNSDERIILRLEEISRTLKGDSDE